MRSTATGWCAAISAPRTTSGPPTRSPVSTPMTICRSRRRPPDHRGLGSAARRRTPPAPLQTARIRPYPLFNVALNLVGGKNLAWQQRKAASFIFSPEYCGFEYRVDEDNEQERKQVRQDGGPAGAARGGVSQRLRTHRDHANDPTSLTVGLAVATSGAAASPNMGYHTSPTLAFLMTIFNVRLGWWLRNPRWAKVWTDKRSRLSLSRAAERAARHDHRRSIVGVSLGRRALREPRRLRTGPPPLPVHHRQRCRPGRPRHLRGSRQRHREVPRRFRRRHRNRSDQYPPRHRPLQRMALCDRHHPLRQPESRRSGRARCSTSRARSPATSRPMCCATPRSIRRFRTRAPPISSSTNRNSRAIARSAITSAATSCRLPPSATRWRRKRWSSSLPTFASNGRCPRRRPRTRSGNTRARCRTSGRRCGRRRSSHFSTRSSFPSGSASSRPARPSTGSPRCRRRRLPRRRRGPMSITGCPSLRRNGAPDSMSAARCCN